MSNDFVRSMKHTDIDKVVLIHLQSFKDFFLSSLGKSFLQLLYTEILDDQSGISLVYEVQGELCGFAVGTDSPNGFYKKMLSQKLISFAISAIVPVLYNPRIIPRLIRALRIPSSYTEESKHAMLMSIAILPSLQNCGGGSLLLDAFVNTCISRQVKVIILTTDDKDNDHVNIFYQKHGFKKNRVFTTNEGRNMNEYQLVLSS
jgi:ribosomal protein S18 acetylase RimI-like enzyme